MIFKIFLHLLASAWNKLSRSIESGILIYEWINSNGVTVPFEQKPNPTCWENNKFNNTDLINVVFPEAFGPVIILFFPISILLVTTVFASTKGGYNKSLNFTNGWTREGSTSH